MPARTPLPALPGRFADSPHTPSWRVLALAASVAFLSACGSSDSPAPTPPPPPPAAASVQVLSGPAEWVSGGDARIAVSATNVPADELELWLNGTRLTTPMKSSETNDGVRLEGVIDGMANGANTLQVRHGDTVLASLDLTNHPIEGPMFSGAHQSPFVCAGPRRFGREPVVDSTDPNHFEVRDAGGATIGYSKNCTLDTWVEYVYMPVGGTETGHYKPLPADGSRPADMSTAARHDQPLHLPVLHAGAAGRRS